MEKMPPDLRMFWCHVLQHPLDVSEMVRNHFSGQEIRSNVEPDMKQIGKKRQRQDVTFYDSLGRTHRDKKTHGAVYVGKRPKNALNPVNILQRNGNVDIDGVDESIMSRGNVFDATEFLHEAEDARRAHLNSTFAMENSQLHNVEEMAPEYSTANYAANHNVNREIPPRVAHRVEPPINLETQPPVESPVQSSDQHPVQLPDQHPMQSPNQHPEQSPHQQPPQQSYVQPPPKKKRRLNKDSEIVMQRPANSANWTGNSADQVADIINNVPSPNDLAKAQRAHARKEAEKKSHLVEYWCHDPDKLSEEAFRRMYEQLKRDERIKYIYQRMAHESATRGGVYATLHASMILLIERPAAIGMLHGIGKYHDQLQLAFIAWLDYHTDKIKKLIIAGPESEYHSWRYFLDNWSKWRFENNDLIYINFLQRWQMLRIMTATLKIKNPNEANGKAMEIEDVATIWRWIQKELAKQPFLKTGSRNTEASDKEEAD